MDHSLGSSCRGVWVHSATMPGGMASVDITNEAAQSLLSNHILHHDISPKQLFDVGTIDKNGKTSKWHIIIKHFKIIQDLLDITGGHVIKHAKFLEQFIIRLGQHNIVWSWQDSDRAVQHLRCMLRTLREKSLPPSLAPKGHGQLQILIDKFIVARESCSTADDLQVVPIPAKETKTPTSTPTETTPAPPSTAFASLISWKPRATRRLTKSIQVPAANFRTWSERGVGTYGGSYDAGACGKCSNI